MKEEEKIENEREKRRNPSTEEKIMLNIPYPKPYISSGFPNWCIIKWGYTPPPIQKLSHGDHWRSSFSPSIPWFYHEISISFPNLFVHFSLGFISLPHILAHLITDFYWVSPFLPFIREFHHVPVLLQCVYYALSLSNLSIISSI